MSESSLSIGFADLQVEVAAFLGYGRTSGNWTAEQDAEIESYVHSGVRRVYYPPTIQDPDNKITTSGYEWSWLKPTTTLTIQGGYGTGTITVVDGVVTLTEDGTFPSWAALGEITVAGISYTVATRDGDNQVTLDDVDVTAAAETSYRLNQLLYDLPDDFGRFASSLHYEPDQHRTSIQIGPVSQFLAMRASQTLSSDPWFAAVRFKSATPGATGSRQEIMFFPTPDESHTLYYEYEAYSGKLTDSLPYPLGGMQMVEVYIESCLSVAEVRGNDEPGIHTAEFSRLLIDAIVRDGKRGARHFGQMGHREYRDFDEYMFRRGYGAGTYSITYKGASV